MICRSGLLDKNIPLWYIVAPPPPPLLIQLTASYIFYLALLENTMDYVATVLKISTFKNKGFWYSFIDSAILSVFIHSISQTVK